MKTMGTTGDTLSGVEGNVSELAWARAVLKPLNIAFPLSYNLKFNVQLKSRQQRSDQG